MNLTFRLKLELKVKLKLNSRAAAETLIVCHRAAAEARDGRWVEWKNVELEVSALKHV